LGAYLVYNKAGSPVCRRSLIQVY